MSGSAIRRSAYPALAVVAVLLIGLLAGSAAAKKPAFNVSGQWTGSYEQKDGSSGALTLNLTQEQGSSTFEGTATSEETGTITGKVKNSKVTGTIEFPSGVHFTFTAHLNPRKATLKGTFRASNNEGGTVRGSVEFTRQPV
jgi:hypothetical protein